MGGGIGLQLLPVKQACPIASLMPSQAMQAAQRVSDMATLLSKHVKMRLSGFQTMSLFLLQEAH